MAVGGRPQFEIRQEEALPPVVLDETKHTVSGRPPRMVFRREREKGEWGVSFRLNFEIQNSCTRGIFRPLDVTNGLDCHYCGSGNFQKKLPWIKSSESN